MLLPFLRRFLVCAAALLTVGSTLSTCFGKEPLLAKIVAEVEDSQEDQRVSGLVGPSGPVVETAVCVLTLTERFTKVTLVASGPPHERGPPLAK